MNKNLKPVLFLALLSGVTFAFSQPKSIPLELARRLSVPGTEFYVGELPPKSRLPFSFSVPPGTLVVGSTTSPTANQTYDWVAIYLSSSTADFDFQAYYRKLFHERGWQQEQTYEQNGFLPSDTQGPDSSLNFCQEQGLEQRNVYLSFTHSDQSTLIDVQLQTYPSEGSWDSCGTDENYTVPLLPSLLAPSGSKTRALDVMTGNDPSLGSGGSSIILETELSEKALFRHYSDQLELGGWQLSGRASIRNETITIYRISRRGDVYKGTLQITPLARRGRYLAQFTVLKL